MSLKCTTCNVDVLAKSNFTKFLCPDCGKETIVRCSTCKSQSRNYVCKCGFVGP